MKKGFTLVELLIVMVIVGILATIALPKYQASLERGRALEGISNLKAACDYVNTRYSIDGYYPSALQGDFTKSQSFNTPTLDSTSSFCGSGYTQISTSRNSGWNYTLYGCNSSGKLVKIYCSSSDQKECTDIGMTCDASGCYLK